MNVDPILLEIFSQITNCHVLKSQECVTLGLELNTKDSRLNLISDGGFLLV